MRERKQSKVYMSKENESSYSPIAAVELATVSHCCRVIGWKISLLAQCNRQITKY